MKIEERIKMFNDVFAPKPGEKVLFLVDIPHNDINDNKVWSERRKMANEWYENFKEMGNNNDFTVSYKEYNATGFHNSPVPKDIVDLGKNFDLVIAMTEFSGSSSFVPAYRHKDSKTRCASMPLTERRMEKTAFKADYNKVQKYAFAIEKLLNNSIAAEVKFSTGDNLFMDLRNRIALADAGDCKKAGQFINFPSGEACICPYEAMEDEKEEFGESKTEGNLPVAYDEEIIKFLIKKNKIVKLIGKSKKAEEMRQFFKQNPSRANIAELGIGCNPEAVITGNLLEDEKVGLHIAYGKSDHLGGKIDSDMHLDICYSEGCPVEGTSVVLIHNDGSKTEIIKDAKLRYELFK